METVHGFLAAGDLIWGAAQSAAGPVGAIVSISNLALLIWDKAEAAKQCKDDCKALASLAKLIQQTVEILRPKLGNPLVQNILMEINNTLEEAEKLVSKCSKMSFWKTFIWSDTLSHNFELVIAKLNNKLHIIPLVHMSVVEGHKDEIMGKLDAIEDELRTANAAPAPKLKVSRMAQQLKRVATLRSSSQPVDIQAEMQTVMGPLAQPVDQDEILEFKEELAKYKSEMEQREEAHQHQLEAVQQEFQRQIRQLFNTVSIPDEFKCPISLQLMKEPVLLHETNFVFDRKSLETWFSGKEIKTCPITRQVLKDASFSVVRPLKNHIDNLREKLHLPDDDDQDEAQGYNPGAHIPSPPSPKSHALEFPTENSPQAPFPHSSCSPSEHSPHAWQDCIPSPSGVPDPESCDANPWAVEQEVIAASAAKSWAAGRQETAVYAAEMPTTSEGTFTQYAPQINTTELVHSTSDAVPEVDGRDDCCSPSYQASTEGTPRSLPGKRLFERIKAKSEKIKSVAVGSNISFFPPRTSLRASAPGAASPATNVPQPVTRSSSCAAAAGTQPAATAPRSNSLPAISVRASSQFLRYQSGYCHGTTCSNLTDPLD